MQGDHPSVPGLHAPYGEPLPLVVWLVAPGTALVERLRAVGAFVAVPGPPGAAEAWPDELSRAVSECLRRFERAYVIRRRQATRLRVSAGLPGTPAHDADPWSVAVLAGAARDAGLLGDIDPARTGGGTSEVLQGFDLALPADADEVLVAAVGALADGLRIAQLKC